MCSETYTTKEYLFSSPVENTVLDIGIGFHAFH